jgi:hypothetical protein
VLALAGDDVWVVGTAVDDVPITAHWDGRRWLAHPVPGVGSEGLGSLAMLPSGALWAAGGLRGGGTVAEWDGNVWKQRGRRLWIPDVAVRQGEVWATFKDVIARWNGSKWVPLEKRHPEIALMGLAVDQSGDVWAAGFRSDATPNLRSVVYRYRCSH